MPDSRGNRTTDGGMGKTRPYPRPTGPGRSRLGHPQSYRYRQPRRADSGQQPTHRTDDQRPHETLPQQPRRDPEVEGHLGERVEVEGGERGAITVDIGERAPDGAAEYMQLRAPKVAPMAMKVATV